MNDDDILRHLRPAVIAFDREGFIHDVRGGFHSFAGLDLPSRIGTHALDLMPDEDKLAASTSLTQAQGRDDFTALLPVPSRSRIQLPSGEIIGADLIPTGITGRGDEDGWIAVLIPHDQLTTPVAAMTSLLDGDPLPTTLALAADHVAGSGSDGRLLAAVIATDETDEHGAVVTHGNRFPTEIRGHLDELIASIAWDWSAIEGPHHCIDRDDLPAPLGDAMTRGRFEELVIVPLDTGGEHVGALLAVNGPARHPMADNIRQILDRSAQVAALTLRNARERMSLLHASTHDPLTGLANRRQLDAALAAPKTAPLGIVYIDLDRFKRVNDRFGHATGDVVLGVVARRLASTCRPGDLACRLGGDEFVVLIHDIDPTGLDHICDRIRATINEPLALDEGPDAVTGSVGAAHADRDASRAGLLAEADDAMRREKRRHRPE